jgi:hypothetical protein
VAGHPQKAKKQNKTKKLGVWGVAGPPPKALSHPQIGRMGWSKPPPKCLKTKKKKKKGFEFWGWPDHPQGRKGWLNPPPKPKPFFVLFFFFGLLGVAGPPPKPTRVVCPPQIGQGVAPVTPLVNASHPLFFFCWF